MIITSILIVLFIIGLFYLGFRVLRNNLSRDEMITKVRSLRKLYSNLTETEKDTKVGRNISKSINYLNYKIDA